MSRTSRRAVRPTVGAQFIAPFPGGRDKSRPYPPAKRRGQALALLLAGALLISGCGSGGRPQAFTLAGLVTTAAEAPIGSATVSAVIQGQTSPIAQTTTQANGAYGLVLAPATYEVTASAAGFRPLTREVTLVAGQALLSFNFTLAADTSAPPPPANLGGLVSNATTLSPIAGASVSATVLGQTTPVETTSTGADGRYSFWLTPATYVVRVTAAGFQAQERQVTIVFGGYNLSVDFALAPSS